MSLMLAMVAERAKWALVEFRNPRCSRDRNWGCQQSTRAGRSNVQVQTVHQNMVLREPAYPSGQHDVAGQLMLDVQVELLHHALFEVEILRLKVPGNVCRVGGGEVMIGRNSRCDRPQFRGSPMWQLPKGQTAPEKLVRFREVWWVLPQTLRALIPGGIVEDGIAGADRGGLTAQRLPGEPDARFESGLVHLDARRAIAADADRATGNRGLHPATEVCRWQNQSSPGDSALR